MLVVVLSNVAAVVAEDVGAFGLGVLCEVFGFDRSADGLPRYDFAVTTPTPGRVRTETGLALIVEEGLERLATADLVAIPCWGRHDAPPPAALIDALHAVVERGGRVMSACTGAFVLASAGLLDGRRATTHWLYADRLAARFPAVRWDPDVLYVDEGSVLTGAGTAATVDLCLHVVRAEHGAAVANAIARRMVVPPHRAGGQAQYVVRPLPGPEAGRSPRALGEVLAWAQSHLAEPLTVADLAGRAAMSPRSFARHFAAATGTTPHAWLLEQRLTLAQSLLETADLPLDAVAERSGFGSATTLRHHFTRQRGVSPQSYRRTFRRTA